jgi:DNA topoisomerase I
MKLLIVESPAKCNKILSFLDNNYMCEASYGHLREIVNLKNINSKYEIEFNIINEKIRQVDKLKKKINQASEVILATDNDREGEGIAWHILDMFNLPVETKRITFNAITKNEILYALNNPKTINMNIVKSQQTRQILDLLVGYNISPILWKEISRTNNLSAGRCQTPALNILYENFIKTKHLSQELLYNTYGYFSKYNIKFTLNKQIDNEDEVLKLLAYCSKKNEYTMFHEMKQNVKKKSPLPFITSSLQQTCNSLYNISPKECMSICQKLYEGGHITYMRTDSYFISSNFRDECKQFVTSKYGEKYYNDNYQVISKKNSQEAHEAIRPTNLLKEPKLEGKQLKLYNLIKNQTLKSLMNEAIVNNYKFIININDVYNFNYICEDILFYGWMIVDKKDDESTYLQYLLNVKKITKNKICSESSFTNTSLHYTEARLIKELEAKDIGRPSTFASIVEKLKERKYVNKENVEGNQISCTNYELSENKIIKKKIKKVVGSEKNKLVIQPLGIMVIESMMKNFNELFKYDFTEHMENALDLIENGENTKYDTCKTFHDIINDLITLYKKHEPGKIMIDDNHEFIISKNGPVIKHILDDKSIVFKKIIKNFNIEKIKNNEYCIEDLIDNSVDEKNLGTYREKEILLKRGKYGNYIDYDNQKISIKNVEKDFDDIHLGDVIDLLDGKESNILRVITNEISIRNGKFGHYIYYKTNKMKKPKFINFKKFNNDYMECDKDIILDFVENSK